jgi:DNA-3-methyladenine glycosylase I
MREYHDREWGVPTHDDRTHFEFLILEAAQAGLGWSIVLNKRNGYPDVRAAPLFKVVGVVDDVNTCL